MSQKRQQQEEGASFDDKRPRKSSHNFKRVVLDVMNLRRLQHLMEPVLEPLIRRVVKEEVDSALTKYIISMKRNSGKDIHPLESRSLRLRFLNAISLPVFTGSRIEGEGCPSLKVALVDTNSGEVVSAALGSSAKIEIVALEGDFDAEHWTPEEFRNNVVREREGKKPLLTGDLVLTLKDGKGSVGDVLFTDNSSWTRSRKFRLGARILDDIGEIRVREAISEPFVVRDHRGELYKKHYPPSLCDEVWRLEKIGKDGAFHKRLSKERVYTVKDFLMLLFLDTPRLRNILGSGMSTKMWEVMVEHARTCVLDNKLYLYDASGSQQKNGVVFNIVGQVMGMFSNDEYVPEDKLSKEEKNNARKLVISAFGDRGNIVTFGDESSINMASSSCLSNVQSSSQLVSVGYRQDQHPGTFIYPLESATSPGFMQSHYSVEGLSSIDDYFPMDIRYDQALTFPDQVSDSLLCNMGPITPSFCASEHLPYTGSDYYLPSPNSELLSDLQNVINNIIPVPIGKANKSWTVLISVFKWCFSIKRIVARKTRFIDKQNHYQ